MGVKRDANNDCFIANVVEVLLNKTVNKVKLMADCYLQVIFNDEESDENTNYTSPYQPSLFPIFSKYYGNFSNSQRLSKTTKNVTVLIGQ